MATRPRGAKASPSRSSSKQLTLILLSLRRAQAPELGFRPGHDRGDVGAFVERARLAPVRRNPGQREPRGELAIGHDAVGVAQGDADDGDFGHAHDEADAGLEGLERSAFAELAFGENADGLTAFEQLDGVFDGLAIGFAALDREGFEGLERSAEEWHFEEFALGHEIDGARAGDLDENGIDVGEMVAEDEQSAALGHSTAISPADGAEDRHEQRAEDSRERQAEDFEEAALLIAHEAPWRWPWDRADVPAGALARRGFRACLRAEPGIAFGE